jgi:hypothetical protein
MLKRLLTTAASAAILAVGSAHAIPFTFNITNADLNSPTPGDAVFTLLDTDSTAGNDTINFGDPIGGDPQPSLVVSDGTPVSGETGDTFSIGTLTHNNFRTAAGSTISELLLNLTGDLTLDGTTFTGLEFSYRIFIENTPNNEDDCPGEAVPCDDIITIETLSSSDTVNIDGQNVTLNVLGFAIDGDLTDAFNTVEGRSNSADLLADLSAVPEIPVPAAGWLMLAGGGFLMRRKLRKDS